MTQSPYVPSSGGQDQNPQSGEWSTTGSSGFAAGQPDFDPAAPYGQFDEPTTGSSVPGNTDDLYTSAGSGPTSQGAAAKDAAKGEAADLKNTAVDKGQQVAGVAKDQAAAVKDTAVDKGQQVAEVAKGEVSKVTAEATGQFKDLLHQGRTELTSQASAQQQRLGSLVHSFADELGTMAAKSDKSGPLTDLAQQGSRRIGALAHWIETSEPTDLLDEVRTFARRRPGLFLGGSLLAGALVGRLTRSVAAEAKDTKLANQTPDYSTGSGYSAGTSGYTTGTTTTGYDTGAYSSGGYETGTYSSGYTEQPVSTFDDTVTYVEPSRGDLPR